MKSKKQKIELIQSQIQNKKTELIILIEKQKNNVELFNDNLKFEIEDLELDFNIVYGKWENLEKSNRIHNWNVNNWNSREGYIISISNGIIFIFSEYINCLYLLTNELILPYCIFERGANL